MLQGNLVTDSPEPQALQWAARNPWFGTDVEMTYFAYEVHDTLIEAEGMDPNSKEYYEQIGIRVAAQYPERYYDFSQTLLAVCSVQLAALHSK